VGRAKGATAGLAKSPRWWVSIGAAGEHSTNMKTTGTKDDDEDKKTTKPTHVGGGYKGDNEEDAQTAFAQSLIDEANAAKKRGGK